MVALKLPTPMLKTPTTYVTKVPVPSHKPLTYARPNNNPMGEKAEMVCTSDRWNQQVAAHFKSQDQNKILEYELLNQAS